MMLIVQLLRSVREVRIGRVIAGTIEVFRLL